MFEFSWGVFWAILAALAVICAIPLFFWGGLALIFNDKPEPYVQERPPLCPPIAREK